MKRPSFQFYPGDWLNDAALRMCSVGARGLWIDMICIMHQGSDYGYLKVNGKVILPSNLARMTGATFDDVEGWLCELEGAGVFSKDDTGCIFSRRMIRDEQIRQARAAGGVKGGNPALKAKNGGLGKVDAKVNLPPNLRPTPSSSSSSSSSNESSNEDMSPAAAEDVTGDDQHDDDDPKIPACPVKKIVDAYHQLLPELARCVLITAQREKQIRARWRSDARFQSIDFWERYFRFVRKSSFLMGDNDRGWSADIDFLFTASKFVAVLEGRYHKAQEAA